MVVGENIDDPDGDIKVSFGYQCNVNESDSCDIHDGFHISSELSLRRNHSSFSCLSGAALSANATLANTNICNGLIAAEILPSLDSPNSFRKIPSTPSFPKLDVLSSSFPSSLSNWSCSSSVLSETHEHDSLSLKSLSDPSRCEGFLSSTEVQMAGGAAGEDRVQAVCSEENTWLFCAIYDGFNGRDAADFLAGTLYENIASNLNILDLELNQDFSKAVGMSSSDGCIHLIPENSIGVNDSKFCSRNMEWILFNNHLSERPTVSGLETSSLSSNSVFSCLQHALCQAENDFLYMVEREMEERPDLVSVGSCVLVLLLFKKDLYILNLGDSRALLATYDEDVHTHENNKLQAIQLSDSHTVTNEAERIQLLHDHPDDLQTIVSGKVKGKLSVTRAFGVGYLKKKKLNDALMGILRVQNLSSPPYISTQPSLHIHRISEADRFFILGSDGLFDFFSNDETVKLVHSFILSNPSGDPAKFLLEQLVGRAANKAGFSMEELMSIPAGRRRKYHDDVTVIVIILGTSNRTSKASTCS